MIRGYQVIDPNTMTGADREQYEAENPDWWMANSDPSPERKVNPRTKAAARKANRVAGRQRRMNK